jgi:hypothetical protein
MKTILIVPGYLTKHSCFHSPNDYFGKSREKAPKSREKAPVNPVKNKLPKNSYKKYFENFKIGHF